MKRHFKHSPRHILFVILTDAEMSGSFAYFKFYSIVIFSDLRAMEEFCRYVHSDIVATLAEIIASTSDTQNAKEISDQGLFKSIQFNFDSL